MLKLTDAFEKIDGKEPCIECQAVMLNINYGHNRKLMEKCQRLNEYAIFVDVIRKYQKMCTDANEAVNLAVNECIEKGVLEDVLRNQRAEVVDMLLTTFDQELYEESIREDGYEDGLELGVKAFVEMCCEFVPRENALIRLMEKFSLEQKKAEEYLEKYWK